MRAPAPPHDPGCPFCDYTDPDTVIHDDAHCFAVVSTDPINRYHVLVLPKAHHTTLAEVPDDVGVSMLRLARRLSRAVREVAKPDAVTHVSEDDFLGGFNLEPHLKIHIIPRYRDDLHLIDWSPLRTPASEQERARLAAEIRKQLPIGER